MAGTVTMNVAEFLGIATIIELARARGAADHGRRHEPARHEGNDLLLRCSRDGAYVRRLRRGRPSPRRASARPGLASDAKYGGIQAGFEKALKGLAVASAGADLITGGIGQLSGAGIMSLPQIVIDAEIAAMIGRLLGGRRSHLKR